MEPTMINRKAFQLYAIVAICLCQQSSVFAAEVVDLGDAYEKIGAIEYPAGEWHMPRTRPTAGAYFRGPVELFDFIKLKKILNKHKIESADPFYLYIDTPGGRYAECIKMMDYLSEFRAKRPLITIAIGEGAFSAGAMMWACGDTYLIADGSVVGFHAPYSIESDGTEITNQEWVAHMKSRLLDECSRIPEFIDYAEGISEYVGSVFEESGASGFLIVEPTSTGDFDIDMWTEQELQNKHGRWADAYKYKSLELLFGEPIVYDESTVSKPLSLLMSRSWHMNWDDDDYEKANQHPPFFRMVSRKPYATEHPRSIHAALIGTMPDGATKSAEKTVYLPLPTLVFLDEDLQYLRQPFNSFARSAIAKFERFGWLIALHNSNKYGTGDNARRAMIYDDLNDYIDNNDMYGHFFGTEKYRGELLESSWILPSLR